MYCQLTKQNEYGRKKSEKFFYKTQNEFPKNHIYRDIKRLRAYMLATYPEFGDIYHGDGLWEQTEDITEPEFDENEY